MTGKRVLVLGYGNPGRQDDGLGPALAERVREMELPNVTVEVDYQLNIEDATLLAEHDIVLFADASRSGLEPYELKKISAASDITFTTHSVSPESVLAICEDHFGPPPEAWILGIRGYEFEFAEGLTAKAQANLSLACEYITAFVVAP
jgi:hydrogenase maturation protease